MQSREDTQKGLGSKASAAHLGGGAAAATRRVAHEGDAGLDGCEGAAGVGGGSPGRQRGAVAVELHRRQQEALQAPPECRSHI